MKETLKILLAGLCFLALAVLVSRAPDSAPCSGDGGAEDVTVTRALARGEAIPMDAFELDPDSTLMRLRAEQAAMTAAAT